MPKIKTHKATVKRFVKTKNDKLLKRKSGQDHFNSKEKGKTKRNKRRDVAINKSDVKNLKSLMPYN